MSIAEKLQQRLRDELGLEVRKPRRLWRSKSQAEAGTFVWYAESLVGHNLVGSEDTMAECVKAKKIGVYYDHRTDTTIVGVADCQYEDGGE